MVQPTEPQAQVAHNNEQHIPTSTNDSAKSTTGKNTNQSDTAGPSEAQPSVNESISANQTPSAPVATPSTPQTLQTSSLTPKMGLFPWNQEESRQKPEGNLEPEKNTPSQESLPLISPLVTDMQDVTHYSDNKGV